VQASAYRLTAFYTMGGFFWKLQSLYQQDTQSQAGCKTVLSLADLEPNSQIIDSSEVRSVIEFGL